MADQKTSNIPKNLLFIGDFIFIIEELNLIIEKIKIEKMEK
jgi:hypothetical protein